MAEYRIISAAEYVILIEALRKQQLDQIKDAPPGLLISLGDGSAIEMPIRELARRIEEIERASMATSFAHSVERAVEDAIQQAQESR